MLHTWRLLLCLCTGSSTIMRKFGHGFWLMIHLLLIIVHYPNSVFCHTKGIRPRKRALPANATDAQLAEQLFMKWVRFMGRLRHSFFSTAKNRIFPSFTLVVDKNPSKGDFTSIQDAVDSLPFLNLVRVVIKVHEGVYT